MSKQSVGRILLLCLLALASQWPVISHAATHSRGGTMIETVPYETDDHITANVKQILATDKGLKGRDIRIKTNHAEVELTGTVKSKEEASRAAAMVARIPEVLKVRNKLTVNSK